MTQNKLVLIDGHALAYWVFFGLEVGEDETHLAVRDEIVSMLERRKTENIPDLC